MILAGDFRNGVTFEMDSNVYRVVEFQHVKPGKGAAFVRTKLKNVITGQTLEKTFNPSEKVEEAQVVIREELPRWEEYLVLDENTRKTLEEKAYEKFLKEAQSPDNKIMRSIFEKSKKPLILKEFKDSLVVSVIINNPKIYQSLSSFMLECLNFFKNNNIKIDTENFMTMFSFMKEYEDEFVHMKYDEKLKKGEINRK